MWIYIIIFLLCGRQDIKCPYNDGIKAVTGYECQCNHEKDTITEFKRLYFCEKAQAMSRLRQFKQVPSFDYNKVVIDSVYVDTAKGKEIIWRN